MREETMRAPASICHRTNLARALAVALLLAVTASGLMADGLKVGDRAPNFEMRGMAINPPEMVRTLSDCRGDVVFIMEWHLRDATAGQLERVQRYWEQHKDKGLHVFTIHRLDFEGELDVRRHKRKHGYTFPIAMGGFEDRANNFEAYRNPGGGFRTTIIDIDGNIAFYGTEGWERTLDRELNRVKYPGLGKHTVAEPVESAAGHLMQRRLGRALTEANALLDNDELDEEAHADARLVIERVTAIADLRLERAEAQIEDRRYDLALPLLETMAEEFERHEIGDKARARFDELRRDRDVRREIRAFENLERLIQRTQSQGDQMLVNALRSFAESQKEFRAAGVAEGLANDLDYLLQQQR
jgi:hypothetical protein